MRCSHGEDDNPFVDCLVRQSSVRATDGRMEDDRDDDPFDDPVGETFHASSERWTSDCDAEEDDSRGREIDERGVVERVDVCIRGEFLRFQDGREVSVCIALSKPPPGPFDLSSVTEDRG